MERGDYINYCIYHLHSDLSNGVTNIDSVTKYKEYVERAKECGMTALAFSEHGSVFEWWHKKCDIEAAGMKYIHAVEVYVTETLEEKIRDNLHCVLIAKNKDGVLEINRLVSNSFNRDDNHFYYTPRISYNELINTSDNIIVTSACIGGILARANDELQQKFLHFFLNNRDRCFLEIGHHPDQLQVDHNRKLYKYSQQYGLKLIAGTDTHCLNKRHEKGRKILQLSKNIHFDGEDNWDLVFKTYDELVSAYQKQASIPEEAYLKAIDNTNLMADMVDTFTMDKGTKYPHIYDNPVQTFKEKIDNAIEKHTYIKQRYSKDEINAIVNTEFPVYEKTGAIDFMLLQTYLREWEKNNGIQCGYGRGSVSGSAIAYILGITQMDSKKFNLNFFRFINPDRVTNADIDTDYSNKDRDRVKTFLLKDKLNLPQIHTSEIITFNTIANKGAVRDVGRALELPLSEVGEICNKLDGDEIPESLRSEYPELFDYVDMVSGTIVSIGTHPSGVLVSDLDIESLVGMCSTSKSKYQVSMLNMKELDDLMYVKLDILGLDNIGVINDTCALAGIDRLTPDNTDLEDKEVWKSIRDDTTMIFQWESDSAQAYLRKFMSDETIDKVSKRIPNFSMLKWLSFGNGLIRPACSSYRDDVAKGNFYDNGFKELNEFLAPEMGHVCMQETIMQFLVKFCGYSPAESDNVRRAIAKKKGTEKLLPEIEQRFIEYSSSHYDITKDKCKKVIEPFLQVILDASDYGFSWNHSDAYSATGYICGYLRTKYPYEFVTSALNIFKDNEEKTRDITTYANNHNILISPPKYGISKNEYFFDKNKHIIAKGVSSIKFLNAAVADELYDISESLNTNYFMDVLLAAINFTSINTRQLDILIKIGYFDMFGNCNELLKITEMFDLFKQGAAKSISKEKMPEVLKDVIKDFVTDTNAKGKELKSYTITDMYGLLLAVEDYIRLQKFPDLSYKLKAAAQSDYLGYVDLTTGKEEDRRKLYILDMYELADHFKGGVWKYKIKTKSIGSGKVASLDVYPRTIESCPIKKGDIIYAAEVGKSKKGYWELYSYKTIV